MIGSVANLIVFERSRREGFLLTIADHLRSGLPMTLLTLLIAIGWLRVAAV